MARRDSARAVLIYDGECPVCGATIKWIREKQKKDAFEFLPCQSGVLGERFPFIRRAACMEAMQLVLPDGTVRSGEQALPEILKRLRRYGPLSRLFSLPGSEAASRSFYRWFVDRRYHISDVLFPGLTKQRKKPQKGRAGKGE